MLSINGVRESFFWHAPLGVHSTKCRHQSPEWTILSNDDCFFHEDVFGFFFAQNRSMSMFGTTHS